MMVVLANQIGVNLCCCKRCLSSSFAAAAIIRLDLSVNRFYTGGFLHADDIRNLACGEGSRESLC